MKLGLYLFLIEARASAQVEADRPELREDAIYPINAFAVDATADGAYQTLVHYFSSLGWSAFEVKGAKAVTATPEVLKDENLLKLGKVALKNGVAFAVYKDEMRLN